jgi:hypothetical protein
MLVVNADKRLNFHVVKRPKTVAASGIAIGDKVASHPVQLNTWNNYKLRYRPSFGSDGIIELWENGKKLYEQRGGNMDLLDSCGTPAKAKTYMKIGIYKEKGNLNSQELYYDDIEIAVGGNACGDTTYVMPAPTDLQTK